MVDAGQFELVLNGLYYASILYMVAMGITLVFNVLNLVNMAHAGFLALGAYLTVSFLSFGMLTQWGVVAALLVILIVVPAVVALIGVALDFTLFDPLYELEDTYQVLATFGLILILFDLIKVIWGAYPRNISGELNPLSMLGDIHLLGFTYPLYNLLIIFMFGITAILPLALFRWTKLGKISLAMAEDEKMLQTLGIKVRRIRLIVFGATAGFAGLGGALLIPFASATPELASSYIILSFVVVVIGGLGSLPGAIVASILIGVTRSVGISYFPQIELAIVYLVMAAVIILKPEGLFGGVTHE